jgi:hypothetical protein
MTYDAFADKLDKIAAEFRKAKGRELQTVVELRAFLDRRLAKPKKRGARSLKGLFG